jgi:hypothetical protein
MLNALDMKIRKLNRSWDDLDKTNPILRFLLFMLVVAIPLSMIQISFVPAVIRVPLFTVAAILSMMRVYVYISPRTS